MLAVVSGIPIAAGYRYALLAVLGLSMGIQNATARKLGVPDMTTTVLTLTITGIAADSALAGGQGSRAGRRLVAVGAMLAGAGVGAVLVLHVNVAYALVLALLQVIGVSRTVINMRDAGRLCSGAVPAFVPSPTFALERTLLKRSGKRARRLMAIRPPMGVAHQVGAVERRAIYDGDHIVSHLIAIVRTGIVRLAAPTVATAVQPDHCPAFAPSGSRSSRPDPIALETRAEAMHEDDGPTLANHLVMDRYACRMYR